MEKEQARALANLGDYRVEKRHDDGDLTVRSGGKRYVVTTDGKTFEEEGSMKEENEQGEGGPLTYEERQELPRSDFAIPEKRAYPIHDESHARNALARVSQFGSPEEKRRVRAAVHARYPEIGEAETVMHERGESRQTEHAEHGFGRRFNPFKRQKTRF